MWWSKPKQEPAQKTPPTFEEVATWQEALTLLPQEDLEALLQVSTPLLKSLRSYFDQNPRGMKLLFVACLQPDHPSYGMAWDHGRYGDDARRAVFEVPTVQRLLQLHQEKGVSSGEKEIVEEAFNKYQLLLQRVVKVVMDRRALLTEGAADALLQELTKQEAKGPKALTTGKGVLLEAASSATSALLQDTRPSS